MSSATEEDERDPRLLFTGQSRFGWHRYETFMQCPRKYAYKYVEGGSEERRALSLGTHVHLGLAHYYKHLQAKQRQEDCDLYDPLEAIRKSAPPSAEVALAQKIVAAYIQNYTFEKVEVLHVEEVFELDFNGAPLTSRVDLVIRSKGTGKVHVCDHKTSSAITRNHAKSYSASGQFLTFRAIGTGIWGDQSGGPILNMIQTDPVKFERPAMSPMLLMQRYFPLTIQRTYANILALEGQHPEMYPRHPSEHTCMTRYGLCPFYDKCEGRS